MYDAVADEYCYPGTTVLTNKLDIRHEASNLLHLIDPLSRRNTPVGKIGIECSPAPSPQSLLDSRREELQQWRGKKAESEAVNGGSEGNG